MKPAPPDPPATFNLPKLQKKIIYLDQFVISDMMKALDSPQNSPAARQTKYWTEVFCNLDSLSKMQLIVCPDSDAHYLESKLSSQAQKLKRMYEQLSLGLSFLDCLTIQGYQLVDQFAKWAKFEAPPLTREQIVRGNLNKWSERILITVNSVQDKQAAEESHRKRQELADRLTNIFQNSVKQDFDFEKRFQSELRSYPDGLIRGYQEYRMALNPWLNPMRSPHSTSSLSVAFHAYNTVRQLAQFAQSNGLSPTESEKKVFAFLGSAAIGKIPFVLFVALLNAGMARKIALGQKPVIDSGFTTDVVTIATLLPYCDAMFLDRTCASILSENPVKALNPYPCRIFSVSNKPEFLKYLDEIHLSATDEHLARLKEVYGDNWDEPYLTMYKDT